MITPEQTDKHGRVKQLVQYFNKKYENEVQVIDARWGTFTITGSFKIVKVTFKKSSQSYTFFALFTSESGDMRGYDATPVRMAIQETYAKLFHPLTKYFSLDGMLYSLVFSTQPDGDEQDISINEKLQDTQEQTDSGSSGAVEGSPIFNDKVIKKTDDMKNKKEYKITEAKEPVEQEMEEQTTSDSSGSYETPGAWATGSGEQSIKNSRAMKSKLFRRNLWGGPKAKYLKVKESCKKFPYCNQGDINAIEFFENKSLQEAISKASNTYGISEDDIAFLIYEQIFIKK